MRARTRSILFAALPAVACGISPDDPYPAFGAACEIDAGLCSIDHVCQSNAVDATDGVCVPIRSFGQCDEVDGPPSHPPGRLGEEETRAEIDIANAQQMDLIRDVRKATGTVRVFERGEGDALVGNLCPMRTLQHVGNGLAIGDTDVTTLDGLQSLTSVFGGFAVTNNRALTSIAALGNLTHVTPRSVGSFTAFHVIIAGNGDLLQAQVDAFAAALREKTTEDLRIIACSNSDGPSCEGEDLQILNFLTVNGLR